MEKLSGLVVCVFILLTGCSQHNTNGHVQELVFASIPYTQVSLERYPFLKEADEFVAQVKGEEVSVPRPVQVFKATLQAPILPEAIEFFYYVGSLCGIHGCGLTAYKKTSDSKFQRLPINLITNRPIYTLTCDNFLFLITTGGGGSSSGYAKWQYENEELTHIMRVKELGEATECKNG